MKSKIPMEGFMDRVLNFNERHPVLSILLVSLLAVVINCYPVIFCRKSFVSPYLDAALVYDRWPPLPGMETSTAFKTIQHGSDIYSMMWWGIPAGFIESRSVLEHGEIPLWNRYSHAGDSLIGQAVTMLGDPLQLIVIFGHGSAAAWDIKYLTAKFIFCAGFGLLVLRLLGSGPLSLIFSGLAAYCGAYFYINNHPAFFVFSYAPWILLAAIEMLDLKSRRTAGWGLIWLLANFACFNAGHVELAVVLIGGLNLAAVSNSLIVFRNKGDWAKVLCRIGAGTLLFLGLTAPVWMSFLVSLDSSYNVHTKIEVQHLPLTMLPGAFDDLFYHLLVQYTYFAPAPGTSLLVLAGCVLSMLNWRSLNAEPFFWINSGAIVLWGGCVFGWVPSSLIAMIPLLNRVGHTYTDFSFLLVMHLTIQSAYGFFFLAKGKKLRQAAGGIAWFGGIVAGMFALYFLGKEHREISWNYFFCAAAGSAGAPLLFIHLKNRRRETLALGWTGILILGFIPNFRFGLYSDNEGNDSLLMFPGPRMVLNAPSKAVEKIKLGTLEPFRVVGLQGNFMGDYSAVYELEDIRSCAPMINGQLSRLIRSFAGMESNGDDNWLVSVANPIQAQPLLNMLNVKYLLARPDAVFRESSGFRIADRSDFCVMENLQTWPRAYFADQIVPIDSAKEFVNYLSENGRHPFIALTREEIGKHPGLQQLEMTNPAAISPAFNYRLSVNSTGFDIHAPSTGVVCLTEGQAKDFTATANGESKDVLTVNRAFKGIYLDRPGDYHIQFTYRPRHWRLACALFWSSMGVVIALATADSFRIWNRKKSGNSDFKKLPTQ